jgi:hypothetical protein
MNMTPAQVWPTPQLQRRPGTSGVGAAHLQVADGCQGLPVSLVGAVAQVDGIEKLQQQLPAGPARGGHMPLVAQFGEGRGMMPARRTDRPRRPALPADTAGPARSAAWPLSAAQTPGRRWTGWVSSGTCARCCLPLLRTTGRRRHCQRIEPHAGLWRSPTPAALPGCTPLQLQSFNASTVRAWAGLGGAGGADPFDVWAGRRLSA